MLLIGTSGWQYKDWRGRFYPDDLPQRLWLEHYTQHFRTVEVNNAFYRLPERDTFAQWRERTPEGFVIAVKMSRYLTHIRRLNDPREPVKRFLDRADALGDRLGPVLIQLPPTLKSNVDNLEATLSCFPREAEIAVEPRHRSWWTDEVRKVLERHHAALCWADRLGRPQTPLWRTTGWGYLRMHEGRANPRPRYGRSALKTWLERMGSDRFYVYFNNDHAAAAITDAQTMQRLAQAPSPKS